MAHHIRSLRRVAITIEAMNRTRTWGTIEQDNNMKRTLLHFLIAVTVAAGAMSAHAQQSPGEAAPVIKVSAYSEYEYRGISQSSEKPAAQLNIDWSHSSGFYVGTFVSNISWLKDAAKAGNFNTDAKIEWDLFAGYKTEVTKGVALDVGVLRYEYPSSDAFNPKPSTDEFYVGLSMGPVSAKVSQSTSNLFGVADSKGSTFVELNWSAEIAPKWTGNAQVARQTVKRNGALSYSVVKLGATYDMGDGWAVGGYLKATNAKEALYTVLGRDWSANRLVVFVSKSF